MVFAGIDCGTRYVKAVLFDGERIVGRGRAFTDWDPERASGEALAQALEESGVSADDIVASAATGNGRKDVEGKFTYSVSGINAACEGARFLNPETRQVIDLGAEGISVCNMAEDGSLGNFTLNDRCANGAGAFLETVARILEVPIDQLGPLSQDSTIDVTMDTQCAVFAESEVISMIHHQVSKEDIAHAVHTDLAHKIAQYCYKLGVQTPITLIGAAAANQGLVKVLDDQLKTQAFVPAEYEYASALGAAIHAKQQYEGGER